MSTVTVTVLFAIGILMFFFAGVGIRILLVKDGEFRGSCSSQNPLINKDGEDCQLCGRKAGEQCKGDELPSVNN